MIGNPAFTVDFPIDTLGFHGQATLLEDVHFRNSKFGIRSTDIIFKPVVHVVPETRPLAFRLSSLLILPSTEKVHFATNSARGRCIGCPWNQSRWQGEKNMCIQYMYIYIYML